MEHWNTHFRQSSWGPPDRRRRRGVTEGVWRRSLRWHLSLTCSKKCSCQCSSVPVRRRPRRIALETYANTLSDDFRFGILEHSLASVPGCSSVSAVGQIEQRVKAADAGRGNLRARTARSREFDRHRLTRSGSWVFHQQVGRPASTDRGPGRRSCGLNTHPSAVT